MSCEDARSSEPNIKDTCILESEQVVLKILEQKFEKPIPAQSEWNVYHGSFGFFAEGGHIFALGLPGQKTTNGSSYQGLLEIPIEIQQLTHLKFLSLINNKLLVFPEIISSLKSMRFLNLTNIGLSNVPESLGLLKYLEILGLGHNNLSVLPEIFERIPSLQILDISGNTIKILPSSMRNLNALRELVLTSNKLSDLPGWVKDLPNLKFLDVSANPVADAFPLPPSAQVVVTTLQARGVRVSPPAIGQDPDALPAISEEDASK